MTTKALIFDVDGTIAETEEVHRRAFNQIFAEFGVANDWPDLDQNWRWNPSTYKRLLKTTGGKERIAAYMRDDLGISPETWRERIAELHAAKTKRFADLLKAGSLAARPGMRDLIRRAHATGLTLAIATTTSRPNVDAVATACLGQSADKIFDVIAAGDEVTRKKPAPDVYLLALKRLGLNGEDCWAIEDSENGLRSAKAAGMRCLVCPSIYTEDENHENADICVADMSNFDVSRLQ